jgi:hypothetical protein
MLCLSNGKQVKTSFKSKNHISIEKPVELVHINLFGPTRARSINGNKYMFMIMDDFTRYCFYNQKMKLFMNL